MTIRTATLVDIPAIQRVYSSAAAVTANEQNWEKLIQAGGVLIAEVNDEIIGFGGIDLASPEQIKWLYVDPQSQGAGVGTAILQELERLGWNAGYESLRLHANPPAIEFYRKHGYSELRPDEQIGHDHDGLEMIKYLPRL